MLCFQSIGRAEKNGRQENVVFVIDVSGSMQVYLEDVKSAVNLALVQQFGCQLLSDFKNLWGIRIYAQSQEAHEFSAMFQVFPIIFRFFSLSFKLTLGPQVSSDPATLQLGDLH